ncbi:histidine kinase [Mucilaginibacter sp. HC2]|jgi:two-component system, LytTR family, sensor kinase|uniref:sensor histidine kinase n=1 Tax=Mucilaginibacter inviolabilis TaxID=2714892 RepID=UPI001407AA0A|nr:sensor histidine kinase [Mucilaginibacter inviolabilis]NHA05896.1 histidine kinase [Mucilaginibacter inviolabilis]
MSSDKQTRIIKRGWQIFWHLLFWLGIISLFLSLAHSNTKLSNTELMILFLLYPAINISLFYINFLVYIPRFLDKKRYWAYALFIIVTIIAYGLGKYGVGLMFKQYVLVRQHGEVISFPSYFLSTVFTSLIFIFLSTVLKFTTDWFLNERIQHDLENQRLSAELAFLKSQINPHFLFNSLNSIYSLAYQRSETTPEAILKLSEIMRYMLYECNDNKVDLSKELQYLHNYIDLQKIRFGNKAFIDFKVMGEVTNQQIVPLLLIAFIENAFKHGVASDVTSPIKLLINVDESKLHFYIQNKKHTHNRDTIGGIGLNNVQRRLNLLYPYKHTLNIRDEADTYTCELSIVL